jgi:hypothetical protein
LLRQPLRDRDVVPGDPVAHATGPGMQEQPDPVELVHRHLDEMVPRAERAELEPPVLRVALGVELGRTCSLLQLGDARCGRRHDLVVVAPGGQRDRALDLLPEPGEVAPVEVVLRERRADGDHAAADVDADGRGDDRAERRDDRPDGRALAEVRIRHQRQVRVDERHA